MQTFTGVVQKGRQRGRELGYPTINIALADTSVSGIFAAKVRAHTNTFFAAAFADPARGVLEAHLLDFDDELYGAEVTIELIHKIRETRRFPDDGALKAGIDDDIAKIREYFGT